MTIPDNQNTSMPVLFVGHGSPVNAIETTDFSAAWREVAATIIKPKAIVCISAHWETEGTCVTAMPNPRTIHDFYGFPDELFQVQYPAPGAVEVAERIRGLVNSTSISSDSQWGLDHGTWSVLKHMYPKADIPVVQLSLDRSRPPRFHYGLGAQLSALRNEGVLIIGSGNIVHNLQLIQWKVAKPYSWAAEFDQLVKELIVMQDHDRLVDYQAFGKLADLAIPTNEHYLPLLYVLALQQPGEQVSFFAEGIPMGSISMRSVKIG